MKKASWIVLAVAGAAFILISLVSTIPWWVCCSTSAA
jgi:hypothetical protein